MIISRALAELRPEIYSSDFLFNNPTNFEFYTNFTVLLFKFIISISGEIGLEYKIIGSLIVLVYLFGWYFLALRIASSKTFAICYSLSCAVAVPMITGDYWGLYNEPQPRVQFSAALPYLLLLGMSANDSLRRWILCFVAAGLLMWVHPASAPPIALSLLATMAVLSIGEAGWMRTFFRCLASGIVFLAIATPNMLIYYHGISQASIDADPQAVRATLLMRYDAGYSNAVVGVVNLLTNALAGPRALILIPVALSFFTVLRHKNRDMLFVHVLLFFIIAFSAGVPIAEGMYASLNDRAPSQLDIIRALRYTVPLLLLIAMRETYRLAPTTPLKGVAVALVAAMWLAAAHYPPTWPQSRSIEAGLRCLFRLQILCKTPNLDPVGAILDFARSTSPNSKFFAPELGPRIRAFAERPQSFGWKDMGWLAYSNHKIFAENAALLAELKSLNNDETDEHIVSKWINFSRKTGADYLVVRVPTEAAKIDEQIISAGPYRVIDLRQKNGNLSPQSQEKLAHE
jgi:hypothetical protein